MKILVQHRRPPPGCWWKNRFVFAVDKKVYRITHDKHKVKHYNRHRDAGQFLEYFGGTHVMLSTEKKHTKIVDVRQQSFTCVTDFSGSVGWAGVWWQ